MNLEFPRYVLAVVVFACIAGFGCTSNADKEQAKRDKRAARQEQRERDRLDSADARNPDQVIGRRGDPRPVDSGRSSRGMDEIPTTASRVDEGGGSRITYTAARDGTLYAYDADADRVVFSTRIRQDERFVLEPDANRATIDGRTVLGTGLSTGHRYRLYLDRGRSN